MRTPTTSKDNKGVHVYFDADLRKQVQRLADEGYRSFSQQIGMMLEQWLADRAGKSEPARKSK